MQLINKVKNNTSSNTRRLVISLGFLYLIHLVSINTLVANLYSVQTSNHTGSSLLCVSDDKNPTNTDKSPYCIHITKHIVSTSSRLVAKLNETTCSHCLFDLTWLQQPKFIGYEDRNTFSLPDDAYRRYQLFHVFLI